MPPIPQLRATDGALDQTFGFNDILYLFDSSGTPNPRDTLTPHILKGAASNSDQEPADPAQVLKDWGHIKEGDRLFRYGPKGLLILRRSIFTDPIPPTQIRSVNVMPLTQNLARAIAYFSGTGYADAEWGRVEAALITSDGFMQVMTPWDLTSEMGIKTLSDSVSKIEAVRKNQQGSSLELSLVNALTAQEMGQIKNWMTTKQTKGPQSFIEKIIDKFGIKELLVAVAAFHYGTKLLAWVDTQIAKVFPALPEILNSLAPTAVAGRIVTTVTPQVVKTFAANQILKSPALLEIATNPTFRTVGGAASRFTNGALAVAALDWGYSYFFAGDDYDQSVKQRVANRVYDANVYELDGWDFTILPLGLKALRASCRWLAPASMNAAITSGNAEIRDQVLEEDKQTSIEIKSAMKDLLPNVFRNPAAPLTQDTVEKQMGLLRGEVDEFVYLPWFAQLRLESILKEGPEVAKQKLDMGDHQLEIVARELLLNKFKTGAQVLRSINQSINDWARDVFDENGLLIQGQEKHLLQELGVTLQLSSAIVPANVVPPVSSELVAADDFVENDNGIIAADDLNVKSDISQNDEGVQPPLLLGCALFGGIAGPVSGTSILSVQ